MDKQNVKIRINFAIMVILMIGIGFLPPFGQVTPMGMRVLGVFVGTLYGWITIDFVMASMVGMLFLGLSGYTNIIGALAAGFSDQIVIMMVMSFILVAFLNYVDVTGAMANWMLTRKFVENRPWVIIAMMFFAAFVIASINTFASILLMWAVMYRVADKVGYQRRSWEVAYMITGIIFMAANGNYVFPFHAGSIMYSGTVAQVTGVIPNAQWYFSVIFTNLVSAAMYMLAGKFIFRIDVEPLRRSDVFEELKSIKWTKQQKWGFILNLFVIVFLIAPDFLPAGSLKRTWSSFGIAGATIIVLAAGYLISVDGKRLLEKPVQACKDGMMWDIFWMIAATMPIGAALRSTEAGIMATVLPFVNSMLGNTSWITYTIICAIVLGLLTQVSHNLIIAMVLFPTLSTIVVDLGGDPVLWFFVIFWAVVSALATPAASANGAMLHGNSEWLTSKQAYVLGFITLVIMWLACFLFLIPAWLLLF